MMGSGSPFEGMPGGIGEQNGMIRLPYHPLTSLIRHFDNGQTLTLLHSGRGGRYSVLGLHAYHRLMQYGDDVMEGTLVVCGDDDVWRDRLLPGQDSLMLLHDQLRDEPGVLGFMSYDDGRRREGVRSRFDGGPDSARNIAAIRSVCQSAPAGGGCREATEGGYPDSPHTSASHRGAWRCDHDRASYCEAVERLKSHMRDGEAYVVNYSLRLDVTSPVTPLDMFLRLNDDNPAPFSAYVNGGGWQIVSSSPERFLECRSGHVVTRPIKGTRPRGLTVQEDAANRAALEQSGKDHDELLMVTDLERNDLSREATPGTVQVTGFAELETHPHVFHLVSTVEAELPDARDLSELLAVMSPGGSITGAPKRRVMQLIDRYERSPRGVYTGSLGYITADGDCDLSILIRCATHVGRCDKACLYRIGAGGGITIESDPDAEYDEAMQKAQALLDALDCDVSDSDVHDGRQGQWHD